MLSGVRRKVHLTTFPCNTEVSIGEKQDHGQLHMDGAESVERGKGRKGGTESKLQVRVQDQMCTLELFLTGLRVFAFHKGAMRE